LARGNAEAKRSPCVPGARAAPGWKQRRPREKMGTLVSRKLPSLGRLRDPQVPSRLAGRRWVGKECGEMGEGVREPALSPKHAQGPWVPMCPVGTVRPWPDPARTELEPWSLLASSRPCWRKKYKKYCACFRVRLLEPAREATLAGWPPRWRGKCLCRGRGLGFRGCLPPRMVETRAGPLPRLAGWLVGRRWLPDS
jgi:hypothetical protein